MTDYNGHLDRCNRHDMGVRPGAMEIRGHSGFSITVEPHSHVMPYVTSETDAKIDEILRNGGC
jgi:hypothetical protein